METGKRVVGKWGHENKKIVSGKIVKYENMKVEARKIEIASQNLTLLRSNRN